MVRATTNPYGAGHHWVKDRFDLHGRWGVTNVVKGVEEPDRCSIHGHLRENQILLNADPNYEQSIVASASNEAMAEAWLHGSWDIVAGGMFGDVWKPEHNIVSRFEIPLDWRIDRSFDWGLVSHFR